MAIEVEQYRLLESGDTIVVNHNDRKRVALVLGWAVRGGLDVRLHKTGRSGWIAKPVRITMRDIESVTRCSRLNKRNVYMGERGAA